MPPAEPRRTQLPQGRPDQPIDRRPVQPAGRHHPQPISLGIMLPYALLFAIFGMSQPYMPLLLRGMGYSSAIVGIFLGFIEVAGITGPIYLARKIDASGKYRRSLLAGALVIAASMAPLSLIRDPVATTLSLLAYSLALKTMVPISDSALMTSLESARHGGDHRFEYGTLRSAGSAGYIVVALLFQAVPDFDRSPPWVIGLCTAGVAILFTLTLRLFPEPGHHPSPHQVEVESKVGVEPPAASPAPPASSTPATSGYDRSFLTGLLIIALGRLAMAGIYSFFSLYLKEELGWNAIGGMWALSAAAEIPFMLLAGWFIKRLGAMGTIALSSAAIAVRLAVYALFPSPTGAILGQLLHSLCYGIYQPAAVLFVSKRFPAAGRTTGMAILTGIGVGLPSFLGSALGGLVAEVAGYRVMFATFILFAAASVSLYLYFRKREPGLA